MAEIQDTNFAADLARFIAEKTHHNLFLTGKAGTGKTVFLRNFVANTKKKVVVLAPTGIAAINANAMTIHSFCKFGVTATPGGKFSKSTDYVLEEKDEELIRNVDLIIIDEISMVRADVMDHISEKIRLIRNSKEPFGGVQLLLIGDLYQLPPVVTKQDEAILKDYYKGNYFFFNSKALMKVGFETVCLNKVYRQNNPEFVNILNRAREGKVTWEDCNRLNTRCMSDFEVPEGTNYITLVAQKSQSGAINSQMLESVSTESKNYTATIIGDFPEDSFPTNRELMLKIGVQVMMIKNDKEGKYCNGTIGTVVGFEDGTVLVEVDNETIEVELSEWDNNQYEYDKSTNKIVQKKVGTFIQFPLKAAWAITIHKSQGLSFDQAIIDIPRAFAAGQTYVALSRCRSLEGLVLKKKLSPNSFFTDPLVSSFYDKVDSPQYLDQLANAVGYAPFDFEKKDENDSENPSKPYVECPFGEEEIESAVQYIIKEVDYPIYHLGLEAAEELYDIQREIRQEGQCLIFQVIHNPYYVTKLFKEVSKRVRDIVREKYHAESWTLLD